MGSAGRAGLLTGSLWTGAAYDTVFGMGLLLVPEAAADCLGIPMPADQLYLRFLSVFLFGLAYFYSLAARDPWRYRGVAVGAVLVRAMGFVFLAVATLLFARPPVFLALAGADGAFALLHAIGVRALDPAPASRPRPLA